MISSADRQWPEATVKATQDILMPELEMVCNGLVTWLKSSWACISLTECKTESKMPKEQAESEVHCSKGMTASPGMKPSVFLGSWLQALNNISVQLFLF